MTNNTDPAGLSSYPHLPTREQILDAVTSGNPYGAADFEREIADRVFALIQNGADR